MEDCKVCLCNIGEFVMFLEIINIFLEYLMGINYVWSDWYMMVFVGVLFFFNFLKCIKLSNFKMVIVIYI